MQKIYLDHSATTPLDPQVLKKMQPYLTDVFGNASSAHSFGQEAMKGIDWAREQLVNLFGCKFKEIIFTSGATESNNLVIQGILKAFKQNKDEKYHIITSKIEHPAVLEPCQELVKQGLIEVTYVGVDKKGLVNVAEIKKAIKDNTILVSIMYVNNEIGTIQPIREIGKMIEKVNKQRLKEKDKVSVFDKVYFHTDAVQAVNYCKMNAPYLHADLITISAHKIYGPKGVGAFYIRENTPLKAITLGGHQEYNFRPGTYNVAGIVGLGAAVELINDRVANEKINQQIEKLRDKLISGLKNKIPDIKINGDMENRVPANANISFLNAEGESMLLMLDLEDIAVSTGSACASGSLEPSHVLRALGIPPEICHASLRFTLGKGTTGKEINKVIEVLPPIIERLRKMSPLK
ncbi:MAG: aminotransferase class V-fold PLP-dependent enzyme [Candidatus Buchananbacteria bacterium]|nr:aminotransferase class V-fold PLP-dependent enzyme [Candidatus Buchananbacteria bacterium]